MPHAGGLLFYNPAIRRLRRQHLLEDRHAHDVCCHQAAPEYCALYYQVRPVGQCNRRADFGRSESGCMLLPG